MFTSEQERTLSIRWSHQMYQDLTIVALATRIPDVIFSSLERLQEFEKENGFYEN